jgi:hypothetical protein
MRTPWPTSKTAQLDLVDLDPLSNPRGHDAEAESRSDRLLDVEQLWSPGSTNRAGEGRAMQLAIHLLREDAGNPRTEFPDAELDELAQDIKEHGVLQPIVVHAADAEGRYLIHFGTKRLRAARRAGLTPVPVVVRDLPADPSRTRPKRHFPALDSPGGSGRAQDHAWDLRAHRLQHPFQPTAHFGGDRRDLIATDQAQYGSRVHRFDQVSAVRIGANDHVARQ